MEIIALVQLPSDTPPRNEDNSEGLGFCDKMGVKYRFICPSLIYVIF